MGMRWLKSLMSLIAGVSVGVQCCVGFMVAPHLFALASQKSGAVPNTGVAAEIIGPLLQRVDYLSALIGVCLLALLLVFRRRGQRPLGGRFFLSECGLVATSVTAAVNVGVIAPRILAVKELLAEKYGAYHLADKTDPLYAQFGQWHGLSTSLFLVGVVGSAICAYCLSQFPPLGREEEVR